MANNSVTEVDPGSAVSYLQSINDGVFPSQSEQATENLLLNSLTDEKLRAFIFGGIPKQSRIIIVDNNDNVDFSRVKSNILLARFVDIVNEQYEISVISADWVFSHDQAGTEDQVLLDDEPFRFWNNRLPGTEIVEALERLDIGFPYQIFLVKSHQGLILSSVTGLMADVVGIVARVFDGAGWLLVASDALWGAASRVMDGPKQI